MEREITLFWRDIQLAGTVYLPASPPPHPAVLMLQGSGVADRDSGGYFPPIRETFLSRGIAVYSFDKPGIGGSTGDWRHYGLNDRADQAIAAIELLRAHDTIDPRRVGVFGHSQGAWLAQMIAARVPDLAFAIANSGPAIGVWEQDRYGCEHTMRAEGCSETEIEQALVFINVLHAAASRGDDYATVEQELLIRARGEPWYGYLAIDDAEDWYLMLRFASDRYEPIEALVRARCPFLAIFGALDVLVPAWESAAGTARALRDAGNRDATIIVFPQGNHRILMRETGEFAPGYLDTLGDWAARRAIAR